MRILFRDDVPQGTVENEYDSKAGAFYTYTSETFLYRTYVMLFTFPTIGFVAFLVQLFLQPIKAPRADSYAQDQQFRKHCPETKML